MSYTPSRTIKPAILIRRRKRGLWQCLRPVLGGSFRWPVTGSREWSSPKISQRDTDCPRSRLRPPNPESTTTSLEATRRTVEPGWTPVAATNFYSAERGFGFEPGAAGGGRDGFTSEKPFLFSVKLPEGNYA